MCLDGFAAQFTPNPWEPGQPFDPLGPSMRQNWSVAHRLNGPVFTAQGGLSGSTFGQNPVWQVVLCSSSLPSLSVDANERVIKNFEILCFLQACKPNGALTGSSQAPTCKCLDLVALRN